MAWWGGLALVVYSLSLSNPVLPGQEPTGAPSPADQEAAQIDRPKSESESGSPVPPESAASPTPGESLWLVALETGFREYKQRNFTEAVEILDPARRNSFLLSDYGDYFFALSAAEAGRKQEGMDVLEGFPARYPASPYAVRAVGKRAKWLIEEGKAELATQLLQGQPLLDEKPSLLLALGMAHLENQQSEEAVRAYQQVYFSHPLSPEAREADQALRRLRVGWAARFPQASEELQSTRADTLYRENRFREAAEAYRRLLETFALHPSRQRWQLRRILTRPSRSRSGRVRIVAALDLLAPLDPEVDAARLAALVAQFRRLDRIPEMHDALDTLAREHPGEAPYGTALMDVGNYYLLEGDRGRAAEFYGTLVERFPKGNRAPAAQWRLAWNTHLQRNKEDAERLFTEHILNYPSSPEVSAALYWLGRYAQEKNEFGPARAYFGKVVELYPFSYFGIQARKRLQEGWGSAGAGGNNIILPLSLPEEITNGRSEVSGAAEVVGVSQSLARVDALRLLGLDELEWLELSHSLSRWPDSREVNLALANRNFRLKNYGAAIHYAFRAYPDYRSVDIGRLPPEVWSILFPQPYAQAIRAAAARNGVDAELVMALIRQESSFHPRARSRANARGLMQLITPTARQMARQAGKRYRTQYLYDPAYNLDLGSRYLRYLVDRFDGQIERVLAAYNSGQHRVDAWLGREEYREPAEFVASIPFSETRSYVRIVMSNWELYRRLSPVSPPSEAVQEGGTTPAPAEGP